MKGLGVFSATDALTIIFGSLGGIAALVVAINTVIARREARKQKEVEKDGLNRMDTFEMSQASLAAALARADNENQQLRTRVASCDAHIDTLEKQVAEIPILKAKIVTLERKIEELTSAH